MEILCLDDIQEAIQHDDFHCKMEGTCVCVNCGIRDTCGIEKLCRVAGCDIGPTGPHFVTKCLFKETMENNNAIEKTQKAREADRYIQRHTCSNKIVFEE